MTTMNSTPLFYGAPPQDSTIRWPIPPQVYYEGVNEGDEIPSVDFNLTVQRMIMFVGATRNFPGLHHNDRVAQKQGAAPNMFLQNGLNLVELTMQSDTPRRAGMTGNVIVALPSVKYPTTTPRWDLEGKATVVCQ